MTVNGIEINLDITPYRVMQNYNGNGSPLTHIEYRFSSKRYKEKFEQKRLSHKTEVSEKMFKLFGFNINCSLISDLQLYKKIEKRGYKIIVNGVSCVCQENLILNGNKVQVIQ